MRRAGFILTALLLALVAAMALKGHLIALPDIRTASAEGEFDTARSMARLARILGDQRPHPVDSEANDGVRARLISELRALGLEPRVTDQMTCNGSAHARAISCARVHNVLATIGPAQGRHVLMVSHYDSTPAGPGAADDGIGVAVMLETTALLRDRPLARPVTFLFNEGEESGLLGARAFLQNDPLVRQVEAVVNLEARGVTGPAIMFETSRPNGAAIQAFSRTARRPVANSLTTDFYKMIPNSTDVAVFEEMPGWTILNFAIIGNETRYHSAGDRVEALDPRSVQHVGDQALAATAELARGRPATGGDTLYADVLGRGLVTLPAMAGLMLLGALLLTAMAVAWRRRGGLGRAALVVAAALLDSAILAFAAKALIGLLRAGEYWRAYPEVTGLAVYLTALFAGVTALVLLARPSARDRLRAAFWLIYLAVGAGISLAAPGAAIFFLLPPLVALTGIGLGRWRPWIEPVAGVVAAVLLFLSWAPLLHLLEALLDQDNPWIFAPIAALILLPFLIELKPLFSAAWKPALAALGTAAVLGWVATALAPAYSLDRKQHFMVEYGWDEQAKSGRWLISNDGAPLPQTVPPLAPFQPDVEVPWSARPRWATAAPAGLVQAPALERLAERRTPHGRLLSFRLRLNGADSVTLRAPPQARLLAVRMGGAMRRFGTGEAEDDYFLRCVGRSCEGQRVDLLVGSAAPVEAKLIGIRSGLPAEGQALLGARPADAQPQYGTDSSIGITRIFL